MERTRLIKIPKNIKAMNDYNFGIQNTDDIEEYQLTKEQYNYFNNMNLFNEINLKCEIIIDDYEEEMLEYQKIPIALDIVDTYLIKNKNKNLNLLMFKKILSKAFAYKTCVGFEF